MPVDAIEHQHVMIDFPQHALKVRHKRTYVLAPAHVCFCISIDRLCLQALVDCCGRPLEQMSTRDAFLALHYHVSSAASLEVQSDDAALSSGLRAICDQGGRIGQRWLSKSAFGASQVFVQKAY